MINIIENNYDAIPPPPPLIAQKTVIFRRYYNKYAVPCLEAMDEMNNYILSIVRDAPRNVIMSEEFNRVTQIFKDRLQFSPVWFTLSVDYLLDVLMSMVNILRKVGRAMHCEELCYAKDIPDLFPIYHDL